MVGLQTLDLAIGVRVPASQPKTIKRLLKKKNFSFFHSFQYRAAAPKNKTLFESEISTQRAHI